MANTVSLLSYANTFGDWVVTTNALVRENNDLAGDNYTKAKGTLTVGNILTPAGTTVFNVLNDAVVGGQLQVQGTGSSARIQNNLTVTQGQVYFPSYLNVHHMVGWSKLGSRWPSSNWPSI